MLQAYLMDSPPSASSASATEPARRRQRAVVELEALEAPVLAWLRACSRSFRLLDGGGCGRVRVRRPDGSADSLRADQLSPANHELLGPSQRTWLETFWSGELARCLMEGFGVGWEQREEEEEEQVRLQKDREPEQQQQQQHEQEEQQQQQQHEQQQQDDCIPPDRAARQARRRHRLFLERLAPLLGGPSGAELLRQLAYQPAELVDHACAGRPFSQDQVLSAWQQALSVLLLFMAAAGHQDVAGRVFEPAARVPPCPRLLSVTRRLGIRIGGGGGGIGSLRRLSWQWAKFAAAERRLAPDSGPGQPLPLDKFQRSVLLNGEDDDGNGGDFQQQRRP